MFLNKKNFIALFLLVNIFVISTATLAMDEAAISPTVDGRHTPQLERTLVDTRNEFSTNVTIPVINYCAALLNAIKNDDMAQIRYYFEDFFSKISYNIQNISRNNESFYKAFSWILCKCLANCTFNPNPTALLWDDNNNTVLLLLTYNNHFYVLQFFVSNENTQQEIYTYQIPGSNTQITVIGVQFILKNLETLKEIKVRQLFNNGPKRMDIQETAFLNLLEEQETGSLYNSNNMYKKAISGININAVSQPNINFTDIKESSLLKTMLTDLYDMPIWWHVNLEKFYQALFANLLTFLGLGVTMAEVPTWDGRADFILYRPIETPIIFEFKLNHTAEEALQQIFLRRYYTNMNSDVELVGVNVNLNPFLDCNITTVYGNYEQPHNATPMMHITPAGLPPQSRLQRR